jgi:hypothetical protein
VIFHCGPLPDALEKTILSENSPSYGCRTCIESNHVFRHETTFFVITVHGCDERKDTDTMEAEVMVKVALKTAKVRADLLKRTARGEPEPTEVVLA